VTVGWDEAEVRRWLRGQKAAQRQIERERIRALLNLTPERSWETYLSLLQVGGGYGGDAAGPSYVLWAMRRVLHAIEQSK